MGTEAEDELVELPKQYWELVRLVGLEATMCLCQEYGGSNPYIPKMDKIMEQKRRELILKEWTGYNVRQLSKKYGLSERWVREIAKGKGKPPIEGQMSLEDLMKS